MEVQRPADIGDAGEAGKHVGEEAVQLRMVSAEVVHFPPRAQDFRLAMPFACLPIARFPPCARVFCSKASAAFLQRLQFRRGREDVLPAAALEHGDAGEAAEGPADAIAGGQRVILDIAVPRGREVEAHGEKHIRVGAEKDVFAEGKALRQQVFAEVLTEESAFFSGVHGRVSLRAGSAGGQVPLARG